MVVVVVAVAVTAAVVVVAEIVAAAALLALSVQQASVYYFKLISVGSDILFNVLYLLAHPSILLGINIFHDGNMY